MSIPAYIRPQVLLDEILNSVAPATIQNQNAFVIGPNYFLRRYTDLSERALIGAGAYDPVAGNTLDYPSRPASCSIDTGYVRLWLRDATLEYFTDLVGSGAVINVKADAQRNKVYSSGLVFKTANGFTRSAAFLRDVQAGDRIYTKGTQGIDYIQSSRVVDLEADVVAEIIDAPANAPYNKSTQIASLSAVTKVGSSTDVVGTVAGTYLTDLANGIISDVFTATCTTSSTGGVLTTARFRITSASGTVDVANVAPVGASWGGTVTLTHASMRGVTITFTNTSSPDFVSGEQFIYTANAAFTTVVEPGNMASGGSYSGSLDTTYLLTVVEGGGLTEADVSVRVTDTKGSDASSTVAIVYNTPVSIGSKGVTVTFKANSNTEGGAFTNGGLRLGDVYTIEVLAQSAGAIHTLVLADNLSTSLNAADQGSPTDLEVRLYIFKSEVEVPAKRLWSVPNYNFEAGADTLVVESGVKLQDPSWVDNMGDLPYLPVKSGTMYVHYRALNQAGTNSIKTITDVNDIAQVGEKVDVDDPLTYAVYMAALNSGSMYVNYARVATDDLAGYLAVLNVATQNNKVYCLNVATDDLAVHDALLAHVDAMSANNKRKWRRAYISSTLPVESVKVDRDPAGAYYLGTLTGTGNKGLTITNGLMLTAGVLPGDLLDISFVNDGYGEETYSTYTIAAVNTETTATLSAGPAAPIGVPTRVRIRHVLSREDQASTIAAQATHVADRRGCLVFPPVSYRSGLSQPGWAIAAAIAALRSSVLPQQGLTNTEVKGIDDVPLTYAYFTDDQLDTIAASGVYIITQDVQSGAVYVRHQLTTKVDTILEREDSIGTNVDAMAYLFVDRLSPYIGRYNNTPAFRRFLNTVTQGTIDFLTSSTSSPTADGNIGPQLINGEILLLETVPGAQDRIRIRVKLTVPTPVNNIDIELEIVLEA